MSMSDAATNGEVAVAEMSRDELEAEVDELRQRVADLEEAVDKVQSNYTHQSSVNVLLNALLGEGVDDFTADPAQLRDLVADFGRRVSELEQTTAKQQSVINTLGEGTARNKGEAWLDIVDAAQKLADSRDNALPGNRVRLYIENIEQATGKSSRQASNYIDDFGQDESTDKKPGATARPYKPPSAANGNEAQKKSLVVDLDVWGEDDD